MRQTGPLPAPLPGVPLGGKRILRGLILAALLALAPPAFAEAPSEPPNPAAAPRAKVVTVGQAEAPQRRAAAAPARTVPSEPIRLALNKSTEIVLPAEVKDIIVGNPEVADVVVHAPTRVFLTGRGPGQTSVVLLDRAGVVLRRFEVDVAIDAVALREVLRQVLPDERNLQVSAVAEAVYLSGTVRNDATVATARRLARRFVKDDDSVVVVLRVGGDQQVLLHVKVAEMQKSVMKELGVGLNTSSAIPLGELRANIATDAMVGLSSTTTQLFGAATITGINHLTASLAVLERQGLIKTLVEPNLTAVSGETASMLAGGELPIPIADSNGQISIEFKPFGVLLSFTPVVLDPGRLSLKMSTEVSSLSNSRTITLANATIPAFNVRRAATTVELPSGGSLMIAGLLQNDVNTNLSGLPGLMDIPVLGALFKSTSFQRNETELVVLLSAYVVQPLEKPGLALPTDGFAPGSDLDRVLFNRLQERYTTRGQPPVPVPGPLQGPIGYIVE